MSNTNANNRKQTIEKWKNLWKWVYRLRSVVLAIPVILGAVVLAIHNQAKLPARVGFDLQATGAYAQMVGRSVAVFGPLAVTAVCLLMMFCSRKVLYPWLVSLLSLALPILIYITNTFQG